MVRRTVRTMFGELKVQLRNELQSVELSKVYSEKKQFRPVKNGLYRTPLYLSGAEVFRYPGRPHATSQGPLVLSRLC